MYRSDNLLHLSLTGTLNGTLTYVMTHVIYAEVRVDNLVKIVAGAIFT